VVAPVAAQAPSSSGAQVAWDARRVTLDAGTLVGRIDSATGVRMFLGVPFAAPPVGERRWRPPQPVDSWSGARAATAFGPACTQGALDGSGPNTSEDCLTLNVWTAAPDTPPSERRPVMVWIYGGAFMRGHPYRPEMDGRELARRGAVVVSFNYRVGPLGFLAHPALDAESPRRVSGNYGLLDQIAALQWVRRNIARFGGDSTRVTVFGVSAGAMSVGMLIASPLATGLFQRAIMESGTGAGFAIPLDAPPGRRSAHAAGEALAHALGIDGGGPDAAAALRRATPEALVDAMFRTKNPREVDTEIRPVIDGWVLPRPVERAVAEGMANRVPVLLGTSADEGSMFFRAPPVPTLALVDSMRRADWGAGAAEVARHYPVASEADLVPQTARLFGDSLFGVQARVFARAAAARGWPVHVYRFTRRAASGPAAALGAFHASEVSFVFGRAPSAQAFAGQAPYDARLAKAMSGAWLAFAATGDPNSAGLPRWPRYDLRRDEYLEFGEYVGMRADSGAARLDLLARWEPVFRSKPR
jgi:para-nitrobenzyl esterase